MSRIKSGRSGGPRLKQVAEIRQLLNYGPSTPDRWKRLCRIINSFYKSFNSRDGSSCHDLIHWSDQKHQSGLEEMADNFLEANGHGYRFWPDDQNSPNINHLKYSNPTHRRRIRHLLKQWFWRKNQNLQRNTKARDIKASAAGTSDINHRETMVSDAVRNQPSVSGPGCTSTSLRAPEAPMFPRLEERISTAQEDAGPDKAPGGLEAQESSNRLRAIASFNDPLDMGAVVDDGGSIAGTSEANSHKRVEANSGLDHDDRAYRPPTRGSKTAGCISDKDSRSRSCTLQPLLRNAAQSPTPGSQEDDIIDLTAIEDPVETTTPTSFIKEDSSEQDQLDFPRIMDLPTTPTAVPSTEEPNVWAQQWAHNSSRTFGLSQSPEPARTQPQLEITYKFISSRKPIYDIQIWSPQQSFYKLSLRQLKDELQIRDVETIIMRLSGPSLRFKCSVRGNDDRLFQRAKREMNDLISNGLDRTGIPNPFEVVIEIEAERNDSSEPSPQLGSSRETSWLL